MVVVVEIGFRKSKGLTMNEKRRTKETVLSNDNHHSLTNSSLITATAISPQQYLSPQFEGQ
jgi:hypothetical protein